MNFTSSLLVSSPLAALVALAVGLPALPVFACGTAGLLLALTVEGYRTPRLITASALSAGRSRRLGRTARLPLAA